MRAIERDVNINVFALIVMCLLAVVVGIGCAVVFVLSVVATCIYAVFDFGVKYLYEF